MIGVFKNREGIISKTDISHLAKKCQICNKKAVGFHYGAYVCEACKKFFVRHASGVCRLYGSCQDKGKCDLNIDGRGKCQHCRYKRCVEIGMNIDSKSSDYDLTAIPCQVCGAKSSGLHFGCITCEGCKGFFRRMIKFKGILVCFNENKCKLDLKNRSNCKSCRMNRCLGVGMSRKGIRIGRHTNSLKFTCLSMLKNDKIPDVLVECTSDNDQNMSPNSDNNDNSHSSEHENVSCKTEDLVQEVADVSISNEVASVIVKSVENCEEVVNVLKSSEDDNPIHSNASVRLEDEGNSLETSIAKIHNNLSIASIFLTEKMGMSFNNRVKNIFSYGDSVQTVWSLMMDHFVFHSQFIVKFAKLMPGFLRLSLSDKKIIIKDAMYPMILLELSQDYREKNEEFYFNYFDFSSEDRQVILNYFPEFTEFSVHVKKTGTIKCSLGLDGFELTLLCGVMMFYNYQNLENWMYGKSMVLLYQEYLILYFRSHCKLSDPDLMIRQQKCLEFIVILNEMNLQHQKIIIDFCSNHNELHYPDLYIEVFNH